MRILAVSLPAYGHLHPMVPLLRALRDGGHDVQVATGAELAGTVRAAGLEHVDAAPDFGQAMGEIWSRHPDLLAIPKPQLRGTREEGRLAATLFGELLARPAVELLTPVVEDLRPDLVVYEETAFGGLLAARAAGIRAVCHTLGRRMFPGLVGEALCTALEALEAQPRALDLRGDLCVDLCPPSLQQDDAPTSGALAVRPVPWNAPADTAVGRSPDRPLVYLTLGTVVFGATDVLRACVDGLAGLDVDVLVALGPAGDPAALGPLPDRVRAERYVDQRAVLAQADVVVSHGGSGTLLGALANGLPQLAVPTGSPDQFRNGQALVAAGAGLQLLPPYVDAASVHASVARLLAEPDHRNSAQRLRDEIAGMPEPAAVAEQVLAVVR